MKEETISLLIDIYKEVKKELLSAYTEHEGTRMNRIFHFLKGLLVYLSMQDDVHIQDIINEELEWLNHFSFVNKVF